tara:strand:- start:6019 stop:6246 length:228 start_codon:yes stop_codon:yes gene_type:complete
MKNQVDGRQVWLEESVISASAFIATMSMKERKTDLEPQEIDMRQLCLAFMYLYNIIQENDILNDVESIFPNETIH